MASGNSTRRASNFKDLTGQRFGRWTVLRIAETEHKSIFWHCVCDCGNTGIVCGAMLRNGASSKCRSCGSTSHGGCQRPEYKIWLGIKCRCECPTATGYVRYGGRGISVCDEWTTSFKTFYQDMGPRPTPKHTLERIDNDKGYSKSNCCWAMRTSQMRNMSRNHLIQYKGEMLCLQELAERLGMNKTTLRKRLKRGWSIERASETRPRHQPRQRLLEFDGKTQSVADWADQLGMSRQTLYTRLDSGWSIKRALTTPPKQHS